MNILADNITYNMHFNSPNPEYKSFMIVHGWSDTRNTYLFDSKVCFNYNHNMNFIFYYYFFDREYF